MDFWNNFKKECNNKGIYINSIAEKCDISYASIKSSMCRNSVPSVEIAYKLAQALDVSIEFLLTGKYPENTKEAELKSQIKELETKLELIRQIVK